MGTMAGNGGRVVALLAVVGVLGAVGVLGEDGLGGPAAQQQPAAGTDVERAVKFYLLTRAQPGGVVVDLDAAALLAAGFNRTLRTTVVIHGYGHDITDKLYDNVARALLDVGAATNVLAVDWGTLCPKPFYLSARSRVAAVGGRVADLLGLLVDADLARLADVHLVGHSLGAHVAGVAGRRHKVARITGLDPAQPLFTQSSSDLLTASSADLVDVVHTCVGSLGFRQPLGHVDFYPNRGRLSQPGCSFAADKLTLGSCSHARAHELFGESIRDATAFPATKCTSYTDALSGSCPAAGKGADTAYMGQHLQYTEPGVYFLETGSSAPYRLRAAN